MLVVVSRCYTQKPDLRRIAKTFSKFLEFILEAFGIFFEVFSLFGHIEAGLKAAGVPHFLFAPPPPPQWNFQRARRRQIKQALGRTTYNISAKKAFPRGHRGGPTGPWSTLFFIRTITPLPQTKERRKKIPEAPTPLPYTKLTQRGGLWWLLLPGPRFVA